jgi:FixJ family two-component response regulator
MVASMDQVPTVFIVDESPAMRTFIGRTLDAAKIASVSFRSAEEFLERHDPSRPGCVLLDLRMKRLLSQGIRLPIIVISGAVEVREVVSSLRAGAVDFLEKPPQEEALLQAVREAFERDRERRLDESRVSSLTPRERQVLNLLVAGENYKEIAARLQVSPKTVEGHRVNLLRKLGFRSAVEAVKFVLERRLS